VPPSYLLDTNLLVYCFDDREPEKQEKALALLDRVGRRPSAALPAQVLAEFANVMLYKIEPPLAPGEVYDQLQLYKEIFPTYPLTPAVSLEAVRGVKEHSFRYFDAQIWASAKLNQVPVVLSEDFPVGATVEGVSFENPLASEFDLADL
jgi:predicted nucleic acid-binding protein